MSAPADGLPIWDSNGTNSIGITSTHKTDGYVTNEIPTSGELNGLFALIGAWIAWFQGVIAAAQTRWVSVGVPNYLAGTATQNEDSITTGGTTGLVINGLQLGSFLPGQRVTGFSVTTSAATTVVAITLWLNKGDGLVTNQGVLTITNPTNGEISSVTLGTPHTMAAGESLYLSVSVTSGAGLDLRTLGVSYDVP